MRLYRKSILETLGRNAIHPFPARMAPGIAFEALKRTGQKLRVLDPMAGSGTVLAVAKQNGHTAIGFDLDPLAVLLAGVWTRKVDAERVRDSAVTILSRAKASFKTVASRNAYPHNSDEETREFIRFWFDDYARRQLAALSNSIRRVRDVRTRESLWCGFSRLIITKSAGASLAMDLSHSRPHRAFERAPVKPFNRFISAVDTVIANCPTADKGPVGPATKMELGDARRLRVKRSSVDLVLTSPPYLNAIDYLRCSKFSLVWMGFNISSIREIRSVSVGTETSLIEAHESSWVKALISQLGLKPKLSERDQRLLSRYVWDMGHALNEVSRVLKAGGKAVYVVGDSTIRGTFVRNSEIVAAVADQSGLKLSSRHSRALPANRRYLPPPKRGSNVPSIEKRMRREVVMEFSKTSK